MKQNIRILIICCVFLVSCIPINNPTESTEFKPSSTNLSPSSTVTMTPFVIETPLPSKSQIPTLNPTLAYENIELLLHDPIDCDAPCFWGIEPGKTTHRKAMEILHYMGMTVSDYYIEKNLYYSYHYDLEDDFSFITDIKFINDIVQNFNIRITPETDQSFVDRKWLAYSPDSLIKRYGPPSRVEIGLGDGPSPFFGFILYFDDYDMVIEYDSLDIFKRKSPDLKACPIIDQQNYIEIWMGKHQDSLPGPFTPLVKATYITKKEFIGLMTGDPEKACFLINVDGIFNY